MARAAPTFPITPKMFRHFAAITIVSTLALAFFANGENQEMVEEELAKQELRAKEKKPPVELAVVLKDNRTGSFGPDPGMPPASTPVDPQVAAPWAFEGEYEDQSGPGAQQLVYTGGSTPTSLERKDPTGEERKRQLRKRVKPTEEQIALLKQESLVRAGVSIDAESD